MPMFRRGSPSFRARTVAAALTVLLSGAVTVASAAARTWLVVPPGTDGGDFQDIEPAVLAASPGDTIRLAPGLYSQLHSITASAWTQPTIIPVTKDDLTFIGAGADLTCVGMPDGTTAPGWFPMLATSVEPHDATFIGIAFRNIHTGIYWWGGRLIVRDCTFADLRVAISDCSEGGRIDDCRFELDDGGIGVLTGPTRDLSVNRCQFDGNGNGFGTSSGGPSVDVNLTDCVFRNNTGAISFAYGSSGTLQNVVVDWPWGTGIVVTQMSRVIMDGVRVSHGSYSLMVDQGGSVLGTNVVLEHSTSCALLVAGPCLVELHQSHLLPTMGLAVETHLDAPDYRVLDLTGNWWGTTDVAAISAAIIDGNDDPVNRNYVDFLPLATGQVPTERTTWGDLKASFR